MPERNASEPGRPRLVRSRLLAIPDRDSRAIASQSPREVDETKLSGNGRGVGRARSTDEALEQNRDDPDSIVAPCRRRLSGSRVSEREAADAGERQRRIRQALGPRQRLRRAAKTSARRTDIRMDQPLSTAGRGLTAPQSPSPGLSAPRLDPPHIAKAMSESVIFADRLRFLRGVVHAMGRRLNTRTSIGPCRDRALPASWSCS